MLFTRLGVDDAFAIRVTPAVADDLLTQEPRLMMSACDEERKHCETQEREAPHSLEQGQLVSPLPIGKADGRFQKVSVSFSLTLMGRRRI